MPLSPGDTLGPYRILSPLGAGGMGEVYRAHDTNLQRDVAVKVLPAALARDADYLERFKREAHLLAALHHPNIASIFGLESNAIVMELVEGGTLQGPLPIKDLVPIARQIAEALEAAHAKGIVHRDLKPANIKVTPEGIVKVLDFGLAKAVEHPTENSPNSPTLTLRATEVGLILGTASYMAPEQAAGKAVDRRADIWAFGVVLYELLTGKQLFNGETVSHTLAEVLKTEVDFSPIPAGPIRDLLKRCLDRNIRTRLQHIDEARIVLETYTDQPPPAPAPPQPRQFHWPLTAALLVLACAATGFLTWRATRPAPQPLLRLNLNLGPDALLESATRNLTFDLSPDGRRVVYIEKGPTGVPQLAVRSLDQERSVLLPATENPLNPFFSPDGQWIAFVSNGRLFKILASGGAPIVLCNASNFRGGSWDSAGNIVAALDNNGGLSLVPGAGGDPKPLTTLADGEYSHRWPNVLPDGDTVLYMIAPAPGNYEDSGIFALSIRSRQRKLLHRGGYSPRYIPTGDMLFMSQGVLFAVPLDTSRLELTGQPVPVQQNIDAEPTAGVAPLSVTNTGSMLYRSGIGSRVVVPAWVDAAGNIERLRIPEAEYGAFRLSPDGRHLALSTLGYGTVSIHNLQLLTQTTLPDRGTMELWTPDSRHVVTRSTTGLSLVRADGSGRSVPITTRPNDRAGGWSPGSALFYFARNAQLWRRPVDWADPGNPKLGAEQQLPDLIGTGAPPVSPDGRWLASNRLRLGQPEIQVHSTSGTASGIWQLSSTGGLHPAWAANSDEILYCRLDGRLVSIPFSRKDDTFVPGTPRIWPPAPGVDLRRFGFDLSRDGKRYLTLVLPAAAPPAQTPQAILLLNFFDEIRRIKQNRSQ